VEDAIHGGEGGARLRPQQAMRVGDHTQGCHRINLSIGGEDLDPYAE